MLGLGCFHGHTPAVEFHTGSHGIDTLFRLGDMGRFAVDIHLYLAGAGHHLVCPAGDLTRSQTWP